MPTVEQTVAQLQQTNAELVTASDALTNEVTSKLSAINSTVAAKMREVDSRINHAVESAQSEFSTFLTAGDKKYQPTLNAAGKHMTTIEVMAVSAPVYTDPNSETYIPTSVNGIVLWRIDDEDNAKRVRPIGVQGNFFFTRFGWEVYSAGTARIHRQYSSYYEVIDPTLPLQTTTMLINGVNYRVLTCTMSGGGNVLFNGLLSLGGEGYDGYTGSIRDENFGRYINTVANTVSDIFSPISSALQVFKA